MILVTGGSGFVGRSIIAQLRLANHSVRALCRHRPKQADLSGVEWFQGDADDPQAVRRAVQGVEAIIHLVGIIAPQGRNTFRRAHVETTRTLCEAACQAGVRRWLQMSALGTREMAATDYHRTKWEAESILRHSDLDWTILRPSLIYGTGDGFVTRFARMMRPPLLWFQAGVIPIFGDGSTPLQPIHVEDVALAFVRALDRHHTHRRTYDLCGPCPIPFRALIESLAAALGRSPSWLNVPPATWPWRLPWALLTRPKPLLLAIPFPYARTLARGMECLLPNPPLTVDQVHMLQEGNTGDPGPMLTDLDLLPRSWQEGVKQFSSSP
jgi:NADH dehydrogenase